MSPLCRKLLRYGAAAAFFVCGVAFLVAGLSAAFAWTLIVVSLVYVAQCANADLAATPSDLVSDQRADTGKQRAAEERPRRGPRRSRPRLRRRLPP
jgi:hypothetical protein